MPVINIRSLPVAVDKPAALRELSAELAESSGIGIEYFMISWEFVGHDSYACGGVVASEADAPEFPVLVTMLVADLLSVATRQTLLEAAGQAIARLAGVHGDKVFITCQAAESGSVYDEGRVVEW